MLYYDILLDICNIIDDILLLRTISFVSQLWKEAVHHSTIGKFLLLSPTECFESEDPYFGLFEWGCKNGHLDLLKWIYQCEAYQTSDIYDYDDLNFYVEQELFQTTCFHNQFQVAQWLHQTFEINLDIIPKFTIFDHLCTNNLLPFAKWFRSLVNIQYYDLYKTNFEAFIGACSNGHLTMVQWLHKKFQLNTDHLRFMQMIPFQAACENGYFQVAMWLQLTFDFKEPDIRKKNDLALRLAKQNGHKKIVEWLHLLLQMKMKKFLRPRQLRRRRSLSIYF